MTRGNDLGVRPQNLNKDEWRSAGAELQVNGMDVVDSESDQEMGESIDEEEDEPDFVDVEEEADMGRESPREPQSAAPNEEQNEFTHRNDAPEEAPVKRPANPADPNPEEREKHMACHLPYRGWCPICVKARGREDAHYKQTKEQK